MRVRAELLAAAADEPALEIQASSSRGSSRGTPSGGSPMACSGAFPVSAEAREQGGEGRRGGSARSREAASARFEVGTGRAQVGCRLAVADREYCVISCAIMSADSCQ